MVLTIWQNLDVPEPRLVDADDSCSIVWSVLKSKVLLVPN